MMAAGARLFVGILVVALLAPAFAPLAAAQPQPTALATESIEGRDWSEDLRITTDGEADLTSFLGVDGWLNARITWRSERPSGNGIWGAGINRSGSVEPPEQFVTNRTVVGWGPGFTYGPNVAVDREGNYHFVYDEGGRIYYQKVDASGTVLVPARLIDPSNLNSSRNPTLDVAPDGSVYIAYEENRTTFFDIGLDRLDSSGTPIWSHRIVSSDVSSSAAVARVRADPWHGGAVITFGSATGSWVGRFDENGTKNMASVKLRSQGDFRLLDAAVTPDRAIHIVWSDPNVVAYGTVNGSGVRRTDGPLLSTTGAVARGTPRIAPLPDNRTVVVWEDARYGDTEVVLALVPPAEVSFSSPPVNVRLTNYAGNSSAPWVAADEWGNIHVAWSDDRDGNEEVYYKFSYACGVLLWAEPVDLAATFFAYPNESKALPFKIWNRGFLEDSINLTISFAPPRVGQDWSVVLEPTYFPGVAPGAFVEATLRFRAPANASPGSQANASVVAVPGCSANGADEISWSAFVRAHRGLELNLTFGQAQRWADNGDVVPFNLTVTNTGDVREDEITLLDVAYNTSQGWWGAFSQTEIALAPHASTTLEYYAFVPGGAFGGLQGEFLVAARSSADMTVIDTLVLTVVVRERFFFTLGATPPEATVMAGATQTFTIGVTAGGNVPRPIDVNLSWDPAPLSVSMAPTSISLRPGESATATLTVTVPAQSANNTVFTITVHGNSDFPGASNSTTISVRVEVPGPPVPEPLLLADLLVGNASIAGGALTRGGVFTLRADVRNDGPAMAFLVEVALYDNGNWVESRTLQALASGSLRTLEFTWTATEGAHTLRISVDPPAADRPNGTVAESDETNNDASLSVFVPALEEVTSGAKAPFAVVLVAAVLLAIAFGFMIRRQRRV